MPERVAAAAETQKQEREKKEVESEANVADKFEKFLKEFRDHSGRFLYFDRIRELYSKEDKVLHVNYGDFTEELFDYFFRTRGEDVATSLKMLTLATQEIFREIYGSDVDDDEVATINAKISVHNRDLVTPMKKINVGGLGRLIVFDSTIISKTERKATLKDRVFVCRECNLAQPRKGTQCFNCDSKSIYFSVIRSQPTDIEYLEVQEMREEIMLGSSVPNVMSVKVYGDLTGKYKPGDNVRIVGIQKLEKSVSDTQLAKSIEEADEFSSSPLFDSVIEAHNIELLDSESDSIVENPERILTEVDRLQILALRQKYPKDSDLLEVLVNSFAPYIYGHRSEKLSIILQAIGSVPISLDRNVQKKSQINILLVGDPGEAKSMLLEAAMRINIHGKYASGKGASGVGLTAGIDPDAKGMAKLRVGAVVLAHNGICCIDEFSHITPENKAHLLECMSQGTISINKGGINATLSARTALLVATNPDGGRYNRYNSFKDNVTITDQLLSRFDIVYVIVDQRDRDQDAKIFRHIVGQYDRTTKRSLMEERINNTQKVDQELLFKFILYAKLNNSRDIHFTEEALERIQSFYYELRHPENDSDVTATPRQLEGIMRVCIALCKGMLRNMVTEDDAVRVINLLSEGYQSAGFMKGGVSGGMVRTMEYSRPLNDISKPLAFTLVMQKLTNNNKDPVERNFVILELVKKARWEMEFAQDFFDKMDTANRIYAPRVERGVKVWLLSDSVTVS